MNLNQTTFALICYVRANRSGEADGPRLEDPVEDKDQQQAALGVTQHKEIGKRGAKELILGVVP